MNTEEGKLAKKRHDETWKCFHYQTEEIEDIILEASPNSIRAHEIIAKRQKELDEKLRIQIYNEWLKKYLRNPTPCNAKVKDPGIRIKKVR